MKVARTWPGLLSELGSARASEVARYLRLSLRQNFFQALDHVVLVVFPRLFSIALTGKKKKKEITPLHSILSFSELISTRHWIYDLTQGVPVWVQMVKNHLLGLGLRLGLGLGTILCLKILMYNPSSLVSMRMQV